MVTLFYNTDYSVVSTNRNSVNLVLLSPAHLPVAFSRLLSLISLVPVLALQLHILPLVWPVLCRSLQFQISSSVHSSGGVSGAWLECEIEEVVRVVSLNLPGVLLL